MDVIDVKSFARCSQAAFMPSIAYVSPRLKVPVICLMPGQEIPPHAGGAGMFYVLEGKGEFTVGNEKVAVSSGSFIVVSSGETRGIRSSEKLILFAAHAGMH